MTHALYLRTQFGRLTSVSDPDATCAYGYDDAGRLTSVDNAGTPGVPHVVLSYGYDAVNNRVSLTDSLGAGIQYTYDYGRRLTGASLNGTGLTGVFVSFAYDAHDRLTGLTRSGGGTGSHTLTTSYSYDNADRLTGITDTDTTASTTLASYSYGYDAADRVTSYSGPEGSLAYSYDATNQLTGATGVRNESYSYDLNGNRTMAGYQTGPDNRLVSDGTYNYTYDNEGNTLTKTRISDGQVTTFSWDHRNRLTEAVVRDAQGNVLDDEKFTYDANDHRIGVWANGAQQSWTVYDGDTPYLDFTGTGAVGERYLSDPRAIDAFFAREDGAGNVAWLMTDKLGSVREVVDSGGNVLDAITYDSYGNILNETNAANGGTFKFTAGTYDIALGLTYLWHRWYANGHWLSEDPLGLGPDTNRGRYVDNSPTNETDLTGLAAESFASFKAREEAKGWKLASPVPDEGKTFEGTIKSGYVLSKGLFPQDAKVTVTYSWVVPDTSVALTVSTGSKATAKAIFRFGTEESSQVEIKTEGKLKLLTISGSLTTAVKSSAEVGHEFPQNIETDDRSFKKVVLIQEQVTITEKRPARTITHTFYLRNVMWAVFEQKK